MKYKTERDAAGASGVLLNPLFGGDNFIFRVYSTAPSEIDKEDVTFTDYEILHPDLAVSIDLGEDASFFETDDGRTILDISSDGMKVT